MICFKFLNFYNVFLSFHGFIIFIVFVLHTKGKCKKKIKNDTKGKMANKALKIKIDKSTFLCFKAFNRIYPRNLEVVPHYDPHQFVALTSTVFLFAE